MKARYLIVSVIVTLIALAALHYFRDEGTLKTTGRLSNISKEQLYSDVVLANNVTGVYVVKTEFTKQQSPLVWFGSNKPGFLLLAGKFVGSGAGRGIGSDWFDGGTRDSAFIVQKVNAGELVCEDIHKSSLPSLLRGVELHAQTICMSAIPPFSANYTHLIVTLYELPLNELDLETLRKGLVKIQLDVYNREYLGVESWNEISRKK